MRDFFLQLFQENFVSLTLASRTALVHAFPDGSLHLAALRAGDAESWDLAFQWLWPTVSRRCAIQIAIVSPK